MVEAYPARRQQGGSGAGQYLDRFYPNGLDPKGPPVHDNSDAALVADSRREVVVMAKNRTRTIPQPSLSRQLDALKVRSSAALPSRARLNRPALDDPRAAAQRRSPRPRPRRRQDRRAGGSVANDDRFQGSRILYGLSRARCRHPNLVAILVARSLGRCHRRRGLIRNGRDFGTPVSSAPTILSASSPRRHPGAQLLRHRHPDPPRPGSAATPLTGHTHRDRLAGPRPPRPKGRLSRPGRAAAKSTRSATASSAPSAAPASSR